MINTTNIKENIEQKEKHKGTQFLEELNLRDYFAAKALHYCLKNCFTTEGAVQDAYEVADAMMEARK